MLTPSALLDYATHNGCTQIFVTCNVLGQNAHVWVFCAVSLCQVRAIRGLVTALIQPLSQQARTIPASELVVKASNANGEAHMTTLHTAGDWASLLTLRQQIGYPSALRLLTPCVCVLLQLAEHASVVCVRVCVCVCVCVCVSHRRFE